jgi:hypothetical protein
MVEEVDPTGYKWFEEGGEKLYRIWLKAEETEGDDLFWSKQLPCHGEKLDIDHGNP